MTISEYKTELLEQLSKYKNDSVRKAWLTRAINRTEPIFIVMSEARTSKRLYLGSRVSAHDWLTVRNELNLYRNLLNEYSKGK